MKSTTQTVRIRQAKELVDVACEEIGTYQSMTRLRKALRRHLKRYVLVGHDSWLKHARTLVRKAKGRK